MLAHLGMTFSHHGMQVHHGVIYFFTMVCSYSQCDIFSPWYAGTPFFTMVYWYTSVWPFFLHGTQVHLGVTFFHHGMQVLLIVTFSHHGMQVPFLTIICMSASRRQFSIYSRVEGYTFSSQTCSLFQRKIILDIIWFPFIITVDFKPKIWSSSLGSDFRIVYENDKRGERDCFYLGSRPCWH